MSLRQAVNSIYSDLHSSWVGVILHFDDDFFHRLRYNSVERGGAIFPVAELNSSNAFPKVLPLSAGSA